MADQERLIEHHQELAERHQRGAERDGTRAPDELVGEYAAKERRAVHPRGIEAW